MARKKKSKKKPLWLLAHYHKKLTSAIKRRVGR
jgi:hypothetical protein